MGTPGRPLLGLPHGGEPWGNHPAAMVQKRQGAAVMIPKALLSAIYAGADPAMDPETRDPGAHHLPAEARQSQGAQALPSSHRTASVIYWLGLVGPVTAPLLTYCWLQMATSPLKPETCPWVEAI
ncbi:hypothetical protein ILYODFUR_009259 [Ilyodon furcidens]|uniref:Uncharacterized protein n=1 Tax=Ilyodon furcidens TaxID=33524 RepID=A0ABV0SJR7_9TELE